jgi:hypothetical protein
MDEKSGFLDPCPHEKAGQKVKRYQDYPSVPALRRDPLQLAIRYAGSVRVHAIVSVRLFKRMAEFGQHV